MAVRSPATASGVAACPRRTSATSPGSISVAKKIVNATKSSVTTATRIRLAARLSSGDFMVRLSWMHDDGLPGRAGFARHVLAKAVALLGFKPGIFSECEAHHAAERVRDQPFQLGRDGVDIRHEHRNDGAGFVGDNG